MEALPFLHCSEETDGQNASRENGCDDCIKGLGFLDNSKLAQLQLFIEKARVPGAKFVKVNMRGIWPHFDTDSQEQDE